MIRYVTANIQFMACVDVYLFGVCGVLRHCIKPPGEISADVLLSFDWDATLHS